MIDQTRECVSSLSGPNQSACFHETDAKGNKRATHVYGCECDRQWSKREIVAHNGLIPLHDELIFDVYLPGFARIAHDMRESPTWRDIPGPTSHRGQVAFKPDDVAIVSLCNEAQGEIDAR